MEGNHWATLGVTPGSSSDSIRSAYIRLAKQWHPDRNPGKAEECNRVFSRITVAYSVLSDPAARAEYESHNAGADRAGYASPYCGSSPHVFSREQFGREKAAEVAVMDFATFLQWLAEVMKVGLEAVVQGFVGLARAAKHGTIKALAYAEECAARHEQEVTRWEEGARVARAARWTVAWKTIPLKLLAGALFLGGPVSFWEIGTHNRNNPNVDAMCFGALFGCIIAAGLVQGCVDYIEKQAGGAEPKHPSWWKRL